MYNIRKRTLHEKTDLLKFATGANLLQVEGSKFDTNLPWIQMLRK